MMKKITNNLKIVLVGFSLYLTRMQFQLNNKILTIYWIIVASYWLTNYLSGIDLNKNKK